MHNDEIFNKVNDDISVYQKKSGLQYGTDAYLLYAFVRRNAKNIACDLGSGTGIIPLLLQKNNKVKKTFAVEIQESFCKLIQKNAELNNLSDKVLCINSDVKNLTLDEKVDVVLSNPPYMKKMCGKCNEADEKYIARHETSATIDDFLFAASRILRDGGAFYAVYMPDRMADIIYAMKKNTIEPKRLVLVYPTLRHKPSLMLVEGKKGAASSMYITKPLVIYKNEVGGEYTDEYEYIYRTGEFDEQYKKA